MQLCSGPDVERARKIVYAYGTLKVPRAPEKGFGFAAETVRRGRLSPHAVRDEAPVSPDVYAKLLELLRRRRWRGTHRRVSLARKAPRERHGVLAFA